MSTRQRNNDFEPIFWASCQEHHDPLNPYFQFVLLCRKLFCGNSLRDLSIIDLAGRLRRARISSLFSGKIS